MSHLDGYTCSRSASVAMEVRQRASCPGADARVTGRSADQGAEVKLSQRGVILSLGRAPSRSVYLQ